MFKIKQLADNKAEQLTRAENIVTTAEKEKRELTEAEAAELAEIRDNVRRLVEMMETLSELDDYAGDDPRGQNNDPGEQRELRSNKYASDKPSQKQIKEERQQFENFLRGRVVHQRAGELTPSPLPQAGAGAALIPQTIADEIIAKVYDMSPILERSTKFNGSGTISVPYYPADANSIQVAYRNEFEELVSTSGSFGSVDLSGYLAGALTKVSRSLINNTRFDIVAFVVDQLADAVRRWAEGECLVGTQNKIKGLSTLTNLVTAPAPTAITIDDLIDVHDSVKDQYQKNAYWIMSTKTRTMLRKLRDPGTGLPALLNNTRLDEDFSNVLLGKPVYVSDAMPDVAAGVTAIYYGDTTGLGTKFTENMTIDVLREHYATQHAVGCVGWVEFDAAVVNEQKIAGLKMGA